MRLLRTISAKMMLLVLTFILIGWNFSEKFSDTDAGDNIIVLVKYKAQPEKGEETVAALTNLIKKVKTEPNFVLLKLHVDPKDKTNILLYEEWSDASYYNSAHMNTPHLQEFIAKSRNFLAGPPEISFWKVEGDFKK
ncbi:putative quinol monooxygenase [uncultured Eudoraea sp.]|uniref:putative quinol monooxygenase n=1 Tax=uncultured Eudoraea sp. TaxID=1035614 RepID=UPI00261926AD|nr:putative quinol monooxygenase [uncultured Eudoraea sp.]